MINPKTAVIQIAPLLGGDLLVILSFVAIGRQSHALSPADLVAGLTTALPFVAGWLGVAPWFGLYRAEISRTAARLLPRLLPAWLVAVLVGHLLRAVMLQRPIPAGIPITFVLVSLAYLGTVMLVWRLAYIWWMNRARRSARP